MLGMTHQNFSKIVLHPYITTGVTAKKPTISLLKWLMMRHNDLILENQLVLQITNILRMNTGPV